MADASSPRSPSLASSWPPMPWSARIALRIAGGVTDAMLRPDGTVNRRLYNVLERRTSASARPRRGVSSVDLTVDAARHLSIRAFFGSPAEDNSPLPVILFFHGGGFVYLSAAASSYDAVCRRICRRVGAVVVSVEYRLAPEHRFPAQYDDGIDALRFLDGGGLGAIPVSADLSSIVLAGDSAGANIAHNVACRYAAGVTSFTRARVAGLVAIQPFFGGEERTESEERLVGAALVSVMRTDWMWRAVLPAGADRNHEAAHVVSPAAAAKVELESFPPVMLIVGGYDPLQDWQRRYGDMLRAKGKTVKLIEFPNAVHAFYVFPELEDSGKLIDEMKNFIYELRSKNIYNNSNNIV